jgi:pyruvate formate lyase activating enzyme
MPRFFFILQAIFVVFLFFAIGGKFSLYSVSQKVALHPALFYQKSDNGMVKCQLCPRNCIIPKGQRGFCGVRINRGGNLYTLGYNDPVAVAIDPIEKKPFFHVMPGSLAFSLAVSGCNMHCKFCQNWQISQTTPDKSKNYFYTPFQIVALAKKYKCPFIVFTYTEPTVFYEYMLDIAKLAHQQGIHTGIHTCGYINPQPLKELLPYLDAVNVDLKGFTESFYNKMSCWSSIKPVLAAIKAVKKAGKWLEITNLIIPGENDSPEDIEKMCKWIKSNVGADVPLHFSRFMPAFRLKNHPPTPWKTLKAAYDIAKKVGLHYVYIGNVPNNPYESTYCPYCGKLLIQRKGYWILQNNIQNGKCKFCHKPIAGFWK